MRSMTSANSLSHTICLRRSLPTTSSPSSLRCPRTIISIEKMKSQKNGAKTAKNRTSKKRSNDRFDGIERPYSAEDVERLRGTIHVEHTLARRGAQKLSDLLQTEDFVAAL